MSAPRQIPAVKTESPDSVPLPPIQVKTDAVSANPPILPPASILTQSAPIGRTSPLPPFPHIATVAVVSASDVMRAAAAATAAAAAAAAAESAVDSSDATSPTTLKSREAEMEERDRWYQQRLLALQEEVEQLTKGTHAELLRQCKELEVGRQQRVSKAEKQLEVAMTNVRNIFECEQKMASDEFELEKANLKERLMNFVMDQQKQIEDERNHVHYSAATQSSVARPTTRGKLRRRPGEAVPPAPNVTTLNIANTAYANVSTGGPAAAASANGYGPAIHITTAVDYKAAASKKRLPALVINYTLREDEMQADLAVLTNGSVRHDNKRVKKAH